MTLLFEAFETSKRYFLQKIKEITDLYEEEQEAIKMQNTSSNNKEVEE